jgi:hypothetical protein
MGIVDTTYHAVAVRVKIVGQNYMDVNMWLKRVTITCLTPFIAIHVLRNYIEERSKKGIVRVNVM